MIISKKNVNLQFLIKFNFFLIFKNPKITLKKEKYHFSNLKKCVIL